MNLTALLWMVVLLFLNGFFVAAEFAFTASRREVLERTPGRSAKAAVWLMRHLSDTLAGAQLGITICSLILGFVAEPAIAQIIESVFAFADIPPAVLHTISFAIALTIVVYLHMVIGEMAPKNIAIATPEKAALAMALPFRAYMIVFRPIILLLNTVGNLILRLFGVEPRDELETARSAEDLAQVIAAGRQEGVIEDFAHRLLSGAIIFSERTAAEVMVPRPDIIALPANTTPTQISQVVTEEGFSRIPVYEDDIDDLNGFIHVKDLLTLDEGADDEPIPAELIRPLLVIPESASIRPILGEMQRSGRHLALIVDEHGGTAGLLSLEDIAEELVGEIRDEYDEEEAVVRRIGDAQWFYVSGSTRLDQLQAVAGVELPEGQYETVGGFVMDQLGRVPRRGDRVQHGDWTLRVRRMDGRRIQEVELLAR